MPHKPPDTFITRPILTRLEDTNEPNLQVYVNEENIEIQE